MNEKLRIVHLVAGLTMLGGMTLYFFTGFVLFNREIIPGGSVETTTEVVRVDYPESMSYGEIGRRLSDEFDLRGQPYEPWVRGDGTVRYRYRRPGIIVDAFLAADRGSVEINTQASDFEGTMIGYHALHGYGRGFVWNLWALMIDLTAAACVVFGVSGVLIWTSARERDRGSWIALAAGLAITVGMVLYVMLG